MANVNPVLTPEELEELAKELPEGVNMEEFIENITKLAMEFVQLQGQKPVETQLLLFFVFLLIPISFILFCFCKILSSQRKRQGKEKKKQKEQKTKEKKEQKTKDKKEAKKKV